MKQVICYRRDLQMRKGKIAAQCAHASISVITRRGGVQGLELRATLTPEMALWTQWRQAKIVLSVEDEEALVRVHEEARARGLPTSLIRDAGLTEFGGVPTLTTVSVGPALSSEIDAITGPQGLVATKLA
ncbi:MAG: aminoacyl-tRNA hydrolase [Deltaproteobacteria bacterium]|nr:MAG: aminoacyl-tRNA hydrolase [Deltaproteobacteria bacterium]